MAEVLRAILLILCFLTTRTAFAACHVVTSSGSGSKTGTDWNNSYAKLPATLVRGDIYYLADGTYGSYTFNTALSGTTQVEIRKAQAADHCTDTGWNGSTMGNSQAQFSDITVGVSSTTGYLTVNGNGASLAQGCGRSPAANAPVSDCGIYVGKGCSPTCWLVGLNPSNGPSSNTNLVFKYVETEGAGTFSNEEDDWLCRNTCNNVVMDHIYGHDSGCVFLKVTNTTSFTVTNSFFAKNYDLASGCHGQAFISEGSTSNVTFADNIIADIDGTGIFVGVTGAQMNNWNIYNNVFTRFPSNTSSNGISNGILDSINSGSQASNIMFIGNTVANITKGNTTGFNFENSGGSITVRNNLWYGSDQMGGFGAGHPAVTESNNSCLNMSCGGLTGSADIKVSSGSPNPFLNAAGSNFNLASENSNWTNWMSLASPYNVDAKGTLRTTDRGAYQFGQSQTQAPQPPTGLMVTVQ